MSTLPDVTLSRIPAGIPPPGIIPNFIDPPTLKPAILAVSIVMMTWALLFVTIRLYANSHAPRSLKIDDYFCIIAIVLSTTFTGLVISMSRFARHAFDIPLIWIGAYYLKLSYATNVMVGPTFFFAKSTIFLLYLHIFTIDRKMRYSIWFGLTWNFLMHWTGVPLATYFCVPRIGEPWNDVETISRNCANDEIYGIVQGVLSVVLDLYIFILPIPIILGLQMPVKRRLSILGVFGTAILGIAAAVVGMVYRIKVYTGNDPTWASESLYICITCEIYVSIIVSSMPAFASFFKGTMPGASWLASMNSLVLKSRNRTSSSKIELSHRSNTGLYSSGEFMISGGQARDKGYLELHDIGDNELRSVKTVIRGEGTAPRTLEEGVVHKTIAVHQSMRQDTPTA